MSIDDELAALRKERPRPEPDPTAALIDLLDAVLRNDTSIPEAVAAYTETLNAHIDRRVGRYMRGAGEIAP